MNVRLFKKASALAPMSIQELEDFAWSAFSAVVVRGAIPTAAVVLLPPPDYPVICMPEKDSGTIEAWLLAHEVGHLVMGHNAWSPSWFVREVQANHFAKRATGNLIDLKTYTAWVAATFPKGIRSTDRGTAKAS